MRNGGSTWLLRSVAMLVLAVPARAAVSISAARTDLLYSANTDVDCSKLFAIQDDTKLPASVVRLHAMVDNPPANARYHWSIREPVVGTFAADLDLGPSAQTSAIVGMCEEFGNECLLTKDQLKFYNEPSILWLAPTCDILPTNTSRQFGGATARIKLKVKSGKRKLGKATYTIGYGRNGGLVVSVMPANDDPFIDGIGRSGPVILPFVNPTFGGTLTPPVAGPGLAVPEPNLVDTWKLDGSLGAGTLFQPCGFPNIDACGEVLLRLGTGIETLAAEYPDGSALCDNIKVSVQDCNPNPKLEVTAKPKRDTYDPANPNRSTVDLTVKFTNASKGTENMPACNFLLQGAGILTCTAELKVGQIEDTKTSTFGLPHCSVTTNVPCESDAECRPPQCPECALNEVCITSPHCSITFEKACVSDEDCNNTGSPPPCPLCKADETCMKFLAVSSNTIFLLPGESVILLQTPAVLQNKFTDTASLKDTWTVNVAIPSVSDSKVLRYKIKGNPQLAPTP